MLAWRDEAVLLGELSVRSCLQSQQESDDQHVIKMGNDNRTPTRVLRQAALEWFHLRPTQTGRCRTAAQPPLCCLLTLHLKACSITPDTCHGVVLQGLQ